MVGHRNSWVRTRTLQGIEMSAGGSAVGSTSSVSTGEEDGIRVARIQGYADKVRVFVPSPLPFSSQEQYIPVLSSFLQVSEGKLLMFLYVRAVALAFRSRLR